MICLFVAILAQALRRCLRVCFRNDKHCLRDLSSHCRKFSKEIVLTSGEGLSIELHVKILNDNTYIRY